MSADETYDGEPEPISEELEELADDVMDAALDAMCNKGEFSPLLAVENAQGERVMLSFDDEELEECLDAARGMVATAASGKKPIKGLPGGPVRGHPRERRRPLRERRHHRVRRGGPERGILGVPAVPEPGQTSRVCVDGPRRGRGDGVARLEGAIV